jgi:hypothetical protein
MDFFGSNVKTRKISKTRNLWRLRYRLYSLFIVFLLFLVVFAGSAQTYSYQNVVNTTDFNILNEGLLASEVDPVYSSPNDDEESRLSFIIYNNYNDLSKVGVDQDGKKMEGAYLSDGFIVSSPYFDARSVGSDNDNNNGGGSIADIIKAPSNPQYTNRLFYPKYNINDVPILYSTFDDVFIRSQDGSVVPRDTNARNSSFQRLLKQGIVHLYSTALPGEVGNSYIVGHSSDYAPITAYSAIFKPIERRSQPGEEFIIYDNQGRKLVFRVFDTLRITADQADEAYRDFGDKRVVTLQTSIVVNPNVIDRWLTRGELILEESGEQ